MSQLKTYARDGRDLFIWPDGGELNKPGQFVRHTTFLSNSFGLVVAIDETKVSVLWSKQPLVNINDTGYVFAPYVPLQVTPTIFDPTTYATKSIARYSKHVINHSFFDTVSIK